MTHLIDITGQTFGRLTVISRAGCDASGRTLWTCACRCGSEVVMSGRRMRNGQAQSCGCLQREMTIVRSTKHGCAVLPSRTPEYRTWLMMKNRCLNPRAMDYKYYGGRGIQVCERWKNSFAMFLADMGPRPSLQHSIDRYPDNNGDYDPDNCRWATKKEQIANRRGSQPHG